MENSHDIWLYLRIVSCRSSAHHITAILGNSEYSWFIWKSHSPRHPCTHCNKLVWIDICKLPFILWHHGILNVESFSVYVTFSHVLKNPYSVIKFLPWHWWFFVSLFFVKIVWSQLWSLSCYSFEQSKVTFYSSSHHPSILMVKIQP